MPNNNDLTQRSGNPQPPAGERFTSQGSTLNTPIECRCGSTFFFTVYAEEFAGGGYGSIEMRSLSNGPQVLRVCPCGEVYAPSKSAAGGARQVLNARDRFYDSIKKAKGFRDRVNPDAIARVTASKSEVDELRDRVDALEAALQEAKQSHPILSLGLQNLPNATNVPNLPSEGVLVAGPIVGAPPASFSEDTDETVSGTLTVTKQKHSPRKKS